MLDGKLAMRVCGADKGNNSTRKTARNSSQSTYMIKIVSTTKTPEITHLKHTRSATRGGVGGMCERQVGAIGSSGKAVTGWGGTNVIHQEAGGWKWALLSSMLGLGIATVAEGSSPSSTLRPEG